MKFKRYNLISLACGLALILFAAMAHAQHGVEFVRPDAIIDLRTDDGAKQVQGQWRYADAKIIEVDHHLPGPDLKPTGAPSRTRDITPKAGPADVDDSQWSAIPASSLEVRRSNGRLSFAWYRINVTIPEKLGDFDPAGSTVYFEISVDDYAEVWVDGKLPQVLGQSGGPFVKGWNAPNRVLLTREAKPGQKFQLAVFAMNGPISDPPGNFIWVRSAALDFYSREHARVGKPVKTGIVRLDPALDQIIAPGTTIEQLADGFGFTEGPVWVPGIDGADGHLLFSDPNNNTIYRWSTDGQINIFRTHSGYTGANIGEYHQPGSNGLALDPQGRLTINEHGNRRVTRLEKNGVLTVLADRYQGKRLNSPNDLVYRSDGALFFTDPPFGLPRVFDDARKELPFSGIYCWKDGQLKLASIDLTGPNGIAFSPDEKYLYVTNWDPNKKVVMRYDVAEDGTLSNGTIFFDMTSAPGDEALDGLKIDRAGNLFVSGPGGIWVLSSSGKHLGTINGPQLTANMAWGDADGRVLYITARTGLYRLSLMPNAGLSPKVN
jgi:gluconolactonase